MLLLLLLSGNALSEEITSGTASDVLGVERFFIKAPRVVSLMMELLRPMNSSMAAMDWPRLLMRRTLKSSSLWRGKMLMKDYEDYWVILMTKTISFSLQHHFVDLQTRLQWRCK